MKHSAERVRSKSSVLHHVGRCFTVLGVLVLAAALLLFGAVGLTCLGPSATARDLFVTTVQSNNALRFLPTLFLSNTEIQAILNENRLLSPSEITDTSLGFIDEAPSNDEPITKTDIHGDTYIGTLLTVTDPSRLKLACITTFGADQTGASVESFANSTNAVAAVCTGTNGTPVGFVIQNGQLIYGDPATAASVIAIDESNRLLVGTMTAEQALNVGALNAVCSDVSAIIVNGQATEIAGLGDGLFPRAVIGQRADGAILLMVLTGTNTATHGVLAEDCICEMLKAGAVNAAVLDQTSSAALLYQGTLQNKTIAATDHCAPTAFVIL